MIICHFAGNLCIWKPPKKVSSPWFTVWLRLLMCTVPCSLCARFSVTHGSFWEMWSPMLLNWVFTAMHHSWPAVNVKHYQFIKWSHKYYFLQHFDNVLDLQHTNLVHSKQRLIPAGYLLPAEFRKCNSDLIQIKSFWIYSLHHM